MDLIIKKGETGMKQDLLVYNSKYKVYRGGCFIGVAKYMSDPIHGDAFFIENGDELVVCVVDEWEFN